MSKRGTDRSEIWRAKAVYRYVQALDQGDMDSVAAVLRDALYDPELSRIIAEVNLAYQEEERLTPIADDAHLVRELIRKHLLSAFEAEEPEDETPLTVGQVAARLQADRRVPPADQEANRRLLGSSTPLPAWLSVQAVRQLAKELGVTASERFWRAFRDTAIMLGMGQRHKRAQLAAAREQRARYKGRQESDKTDSQPETDEGRNS